jgi:hypothetical protein
VQVKQPSAQPELSLPQSALPCANSCAPNPEAASSVASATATNVFLRFVMILPPIPLTRDFEIVNKPSYAADLP